MWISWCGTRVRKPTEISLTQLGQSFRRIPSYHYLASMGNEFASINLCSGYCLGRFSICRLLCFSTDRVPKLTRAFLFSPRMRFGHFYNMPLMPGCHGTGKNEQFRLYQCILSLSMNLFHPLTEYYIRSGLYKAFTHHVLHRLSVPQRGPKDKVRVTILERRTKYRNVLNQEELVRILRRDKSMEVQVVHYSSQVSEPVSQPYNKLSCTMCGRTND